MTKFIFYDKKCHDGFKKKNIIAFDTMNIFKENRILR